MDTKNIWTVHQRDPFLCLNDVISQWLHSDPQASWVKLANEVSKVEGYGANTAQTMLGMAESDLSPDPENAVGVQDTTPHKGILIYRQGAVLTGAEDEIAAQPPHSPASTSMDDTSEMSHPQHFFASTEDKTMETNNSLASSKPFKTQEQNKRSSKHFSSASPKSETTTEVSLVQHLQSRDWPRPLRADQPMSHQGGRSSQNTSVHVSSHSHFETGYTAYANTAETSCESCCQECCCGIL